MRTHSAKLLSVCALAAVVSFAGGAAAQVIWDFPAPTPTSTTAYPFGTATCKLMTFWTPAQLNNNNGDITEFGLQFTTAVTATTWTSVRITMGETTNNATTFNTTFAANFNAGAPSVVVYNGPMTITAAANVPWRVAMTTPYRYSGVNNLCVEIYSPTAASAVSQAVNYTQSPVINTRLYSLTGDLPTGSLQSALGYGASFTFVPEAQWRGATSTAWNTATNWNGGVPTANRASRIPISTSWTVAANTPVLPAAPAGGITQKLQVDTGGALNGGTNGELTIRTDLIFQTNPTPNFTPNTSTIIFQQSPALTVPCNLTCAGNTFHNITAKSDLVVTDAIKFNAGSIIQVDAGVKLTFKGNVDLTNATIAGGGTVIFNPTTTATVTMPAAATMPYPVLNNAQFIVQDVTNTVSVAGNVTLVNPTFTGGGGLTFTGNVTVGDAMNPGTFTFSGTIIYAITGSLTANSVVVAGARPLPAVLGYSVGGTVTSTLALSVLSTTAANGTIGGNLVAPGIDYAGEGKLTVTGSYNVPTASVDIRGAVVASNLVFNGSFIAKSLSVSGAASLSVGQNLLLSSYAMSTNGGTVAVTGNMTVGDPDPQVLSLNMYSSGSLNVGGNLTLSNTVVDTATGLFKVVGTLFLNGTSAQTVTCAVRPLEAGAIEVSNTNSVILRGSAAGGVVTGGFTAAAIGPGTPSLWVKTGAKLRVDPNTTVVVGTSGGEGYVVIDGELLTVLPTAPDVRAKFQGKGLTNEQGHMVVNASGTVIVDSLVLENFGANQSQYGVEFLAGSHIVTLSSLAITGADSPVATGAAVRLATTNIPPGGFPSFSISGTSSSVKNIDANGVGAVPFIIRVGKGTYPVTPSIYGPDNEIDNLYHILAWDNPPAISVSPTSLLTATATVVYSDQLYSNGGNEPIVWSIVAGPSWLTVDAQTGALGGTPLLQDVGSSTVTILASDRSSPPLIQVANYTLVVKSLTSVPLRITTTTVLSGDEESPYGFTFAAAGGFPPYRWSLVAPNNGLPLGISFNPDGQLLGTPALDSADNYLLTVRVTDNDGLGQSSDTDFTLDIQGPYSSGPARDKLLSDPSDGGACSLTADTATGSGSIRVLAILAALAALATFAALRRRA